jgi:DNA polymerase III epsilon subunit-like protein
VRLITPLKLRGDVLASTDFETTGLNPGWHEPIQVALVPLDAQLRPAAGVAPFYRLIRPRHPERCDPGAMNVHKIPLDELMQAADPDDVADDLVCWVRRVVPFSRQIVPLAHPWAFEYGFYAAWLGMPLMQELFSRNARCSRSAALTVSDFRTVRNLSVSVRDVSLSALCKFGTVSNERPHDALSDAVAEAEVYRALLS